MSRLIAAISFVVAAIVATYAVEHAMTERRVSVPVRYSVEPDIALLHGNPALSGVVVERRNAGLYGVGTPNRHFMSRARLAWNQDAAAQGYTVYTSGEGATVLLPARAPAGLRGIDAVRVLTSEDPDAVDVLWRVLLNGSEYYYNGAAWVVAAEVTADWSTSSQVAANLSSVPLALARQGLGFKASLRTSDPTSTPHLYGIEMLWSVRFVTTSVNPLRHEDPTEEIRIAVAAGLKTLSLSSSEEFETDGTTAISYQGGVGDYARNVTGVDAVYNVTDDPGMDTPLSGTWDAGGREYTLDAAEDAGDVLHVDYRHQPLISLGGDADLITDTLPMVLMEQPRSEGARQGTYVGEMPDEDGETVHLVRAPVTENLTLRLRVIAEVDTDVRSIRDQIQEWLTTGADYSRRGRVLTTASAATAVVVHWIGVDGAVTRRGDAFQQVIQLGVFGASRWLGTAIDGAVVAEVPVSPKAPINA